MDGSNKSVGLDNVNAGVGQNKFDPGDVYSVGDLVVMMVELMVLILFLIIQSKARVKYNPYSY